jgi:ERCC4-type nuclease
MQVIRTRGIDHTISFLAKMHQIVKKNFITSSSDSHSNIEYTKYQAFHESNSKKKIKVVGDIFAYQLKQIQGCSSSTAKAIQNRFGTIRNLIEELKQRGYSNVLEEISMLTKSNTQTKIGLKLAEKICKIFG